jgi:membrane protease YdiL (CAAX protease family)
LKKNNSDSIRNDSLFFIIFSITIIPFIEELIFRGFLDEFFKKYNQKKLGAYFSTIAFGLCHPHFAAAIPVGFILLFIRRTTNSLWSSILFHSSINAFAYLGLTILVKMSSPSLEPPDDSSDIFVFIGLGILLISLGAKNFKTILKSFN